MNKPMDEQDKRRRDVQQGQDDKHKRGGQQGGDGGGFKPHPGYQHPGQGGQGGQQGGEGGGFGKK